MRKLLKSLLILVFLASPAFATINILPLGDSITANVKNKSYRFYLWRLLTSNGYNVDFIGTKRNQLFDNFDPDHEGHPGWRADQIAASLPWWLNGYTPDIVLLHIGHNDFFQDQSVDNIIADDTQIIDILQAANPDVTILLAQIIYPAWVGANSKWVKLNERIPQLAASKSTARSKVISIDMNEGFDPAVDTFDRTHPSESGDIKIAQKWFYGIVSVLGKEGTALSAPILRLISEK